MVILFTSLSTHRRRPSSLRFVSARSRLQSLEHQSSLLCLALVIYLAQKAILTPLQTLSNAAEAMAATVLARKNARAGKGILDPETALAKVDAIKTGDEIEEFARDFSAMSARLLRYQEDLRAEIAEKTAEIQRDLDMARDFQQAFLPRDYPRVPTMRRREGSR